jgi:hypothetical protein
MDTIMKPVYIKETGVLRIYKGTQKIYDKLIKDGIIETPEAICKRIKEYKEAHK